MTSTRFRTARDWAGESLFVADLIVLSIALFLTVLGAIDPLVSPLIPLAFVLALALLAARRHWMRNHAAEMNLATRTARERRGF